METALKAQAEKLRLMHENDPLTGFPTISRFRQLFNMYLSGHELSECVSIILVDLDNLRFISGVLGHDTGEALLLEVSKKIQRLLQPKDLISRLRGSEFIIMIEGDNSSLLQRLSNIQKLFATPFMVNDEDRFLTADIGVATYPHDGKSIELLLKNADTAMSHAKHHGKNQVQHYTKELSARVLEKLTMETLLHYALERNEFLLYYQVQCNAITSEIVGMEALLRWQPEGQEQPVSPDTFIPILEETTLIVPVGEWVLRHACEQYMQWRADGMPPLRISVNISACQFHTGNILQTVATIIKDTGMDPSFLCLEITESVVMQDIDKTIEILKDLAKMGIWLSLDDFGTGFSSLSYLSKMPLNELKIDRSFTMNLPGDKNSITIVESIFELARGLNLTVVAEGVETEEQKFFLQEHNCDLLQGYYFSKPIPGVDFYNTGGWSDVS